MKNDGLFQSRLFPFSNELVKNFLLSFNRVSTPSLCMQNNKQPSCFPKNDFIDIKIKYDALDRLLLVPHLKMQMRSRT